MQYANQQQIYDEYFRSEFGTSLFIEDEYALGFITEMEHAPCADVIDDVYDRWEYMDNHSV